MNHLGEEKQNMGFSRTVPALKMMKKPMNKFKHLFENFSDKKYAILNYHDVLNLLLYLFNV